MRRALSRAEDQLKSRNFVDAPKELQQWLQMTYKKEAKHFITKKQAALKQMQEAKDAVRMSFIYFDSKTQMICDHLCFSWGQGHFCMLSSGEISYSMGAKFSTECQHFAQFETNVCFWEPHC